MPVYPAQLPESMRNDPRRRTEVVLYDLFKGFFAHEGAIIYSTEWICPSGRQHNPALIDRLTGEGPGGSMFPLGEIDFMLINPQGLLVLEVKGGEVRVENGAWFQRDQKGVKHSLESPLSQARRNMFAVLKTLNNGKRFHNRFIKTGYAVLLPHTPAWHRGVISGVEEQLFVFQEHIGDGLHDKLNSVMNVWQQIWGERPAPQEKFSDGDIKHIVSVFAPTVQVRQPRLRYAIEEFQKEVLTLTESQFKLLKGLSGNRKALITGGAGTGKTLLAMEKARQTAMQGHKTLFTCANRLLAWHVQNQVRGTENLEVMNFHELCYKWGKAAGVEGLVDPDGPDRYSVPQKYYNDTLPNVLAAAAPSIAGKFDAVIVDEAQDMHDTIWSALHYCFENEEEAIFYVFCDPNQSIWHIEDSLPFKEPSFRLTENLRNSKAIFKKLQALSPHQDYETGCTREGQCEAILLARGEQLENKLQRLLSALTKEGILCKDIAIITGKSRDKSCLADQDKIGKFPLTRDLHATDNKVLFSSVRQYRGMESAVVIMIELDYIADLEKLRQELQHRFRLIDDDEALQKIARETLFIGMSRAQHSLYVIGDAATFKNLNEMGLGLQISD